MKRSEINQILAEADDFMKEFKIELPPFAYWSPEGCCQTKPNTSQSATIT